MTNKLSFLGQENTSQIESPVSEPNAKHIVENDSELISDVGNETVLAAGDDLKGSLPEIRFCYRCGFELIPGSDFCSRCGAKLDKAEK